MDKICVFCGKATREKSLEHILPQWLIKETGNPDRVVSFGPDLKTFKTRRFAFDQFKFPACQSCNNDYSVLEEQAKQIILDLLSEKPLSASDFDNLLTWLDKVRVGLWLGYRLLNNNVFGISPCFFINQRIRNKDRAVLIFKTTDTAKGLGTIGVNTPFFAHSPTCFGLIINDTYFVNVSTDYLLSRRLGLPYPEEAYFMDTSTNELEVFVKDGLERIIEPLLRVEYDRYFTELYQPIIPIETAESLSLDMYQTLYVKQFFKDSRIGKILIKIPHRKITDYPAEMTRAWIPKDKRSRRETYYIATKTVSLFHKYLLSTMPLFDRLKNKDEIRYRKKEFLFINKTNDLFLKQIERTREK